MTLAERFADLVGCTVVLATPSHVVFWNGSCVLLRFAHVDGGLDEAGAHVSQSPLGGAGVAAATAEGVDYR